MLFIILFLIFSTIAMIAYAIVPSIYSSAAKIADKREKNLSYTMEQIMTQEKAKQMSKLFVLAPLALAGTFYLFAPEGMELFASVIGFAGGLVLPGFYIKLMNRKRKEMFDTQLIDALMIMSSSFRGGLSLIQAIEAVVEEMPDPINAEFGTVLSENKMGVSLEETLSHLYHRVPSVALQQTITAILLARETGGNLPVIFNRIVTNIRESRKIQQNLNTLTVQGKIQGFVMALLPIAFGFIVYTSNRRVFNHMFTSDMGRAMLMYATVSEIIGAFLVIKISTFKDF